MLDQKDLELLQNLMESVIDTRLHESEERMDAKISARIRESEERMDAKISARIQESDKRMDVKIHSLIEESENILLKEMDKIHKNLCNRMDRIEARMESMQHEINACKLERDSVGLLIKKIDQLEKRIEDWKERRRDRLIYIKQPVSFFV